VTVGLGAWLIGALFADGWAHLNVPELESFFTPWHLALYTGFAALAGWIGWLGYRHRGAGLRFPVGYGWGAVGVVVFAVGGAADLGWHQVFGIEAAVDALVSPGHLILFAGVMLMLTSPLRSAWWGRDEPTEHASRAALDDLRDTIGLLRAPGEPAAATEPTAGVCGIGDLVASLRRSGMRVEHEVDGAVRPLAPAADLTAYRVVQESLTNVGKHAEGTAARVRLRFEPAALHIVVEDDGNGRPPHGADAGSPPAHNGAGHGIVGMAERVSAVGGSLDAGTRPGGGFRVSAVLPLAGSGQS